ncbi:uncharacterized protein LOC106176880 [Lingula anatina]|uniref:Uncharacterized protein LOC106176880 n=1 Tax=Lingula anatina TaxID=7574 RepID=A0A1S3JXX0_LINAN|nr:uncharacterized protein LOC106176880 [Lingula anatina]XP_013414902.1 uncharacterized protein LOC106176880 [Lingula anatina]|eukprot:XP_013414901.1 uncharacterized protein LOC106176880 [Lingula anatina]
MSTAPHPEYQHMVLKADDQQGTYVSLTLPGIAYGDFDRHRQLSLEKISKLFESARVLAWQKKDFINWQDIRKRHNLGLFLLGINYDISPKLYRQFPVGIAQPLECRTGLDSVGGKSLVLRSTCLDAQTNQVLAEAKLVMVSVNLTTRKSVALPKEEFSHLSWSQQSTSKLTMLKPAKTPPDAFHKEIIVVPSNIDHNGHVNQSIYVRFCTDVAVLAQRAQKLKYKFTKYIDEYKVKSMQCLYLSESDLDDKLVVYVWDESNSGNVHFDIENNTKGKRSFHCCMEFYSADKAKL